MDNPFHLEERKYESIEPFRKDSEPMKIYDENTFETVKANIGRATTGKIHLMVHKKSGYLGIMKVMSARKRLAIMGELNALRIARDCQHIIRHVDTFVTNTNTKDDFLYIFMEYAPFRSLDHLTSTVKGIGSVKAKLYMFEVACALDFLHNKNMMHRDVKPENVFIRLSGHIALGDMGLAIDATPGSTKLCGSYVTRPPEVWTKTVYSLPIDIWMYGISIYNVISNKWPFASIDKRKQLDNLNAAKLSFDSKFCGSSSDLIRLCVQPDPSNRLSIKDVLKHEYFRDLSQPYTVPYKPHELLNTYKYDDNEEEKQIVTKLVSTL